MWTVLQRHLNISDVSLSEYFAIDSSVSTEEVPSAEEICKDQEGNADDGSDSSNSDSCLDEHVDDPLSLADATDALRTVQRYLQLLSEVPSAVFASTALVDSYVLSRAVAAAVQTKLTAFFQPLSHPRQPVHIQPGDVVKDSQCASSSSQSATTMMTRHKTTTQTAMMTTQTTTTMLAATTMQTVTVTTQTATARTQ